MYVRQSALLASQMQQEWLHDVRMDQQLRDLPERRKGETRDGLLQMRASLGTASERAEGAQKLKAEANAAFGRESYALAMRSYLTALWLLKPDEPTPPRALSEPATPSASALQTVVGDSDATDESTLQHALLLNVAAAALRLSDWPMARCACDYVLRREPTHSKALYRLAQAHEGTGQLVDALEVLRTLLKHEPSNRDAARLAASIRARSGAEKKMFGGLFEKAQRGGGGGAGGAGGASDDDAGLYSDAALRAEAQRRKQEKDAQLTPENLAKLPTDRWGEVVGGLEPEQMSRMLAANAELAKQLPDGAWQKHAAALSPENLETARQAVALHKAQQAQQHELERLAAERKQEDDEEDDYEETWLDRMLTRVGCGMLGALLVAWVVGWLLGFGKSDPPPSYVSNPPGRVSVPSEDL